MKLKVLIFWVVYFGENNSESVTLKKGEIRYRK